MTDSLQKPAGPSPLAAKHLDLGNRYQANRKIEEAAAEFRRAVTADPTWPQSHAALGSAQIDLGDFEEAIRCLEEAIRLQPGYASAFHALGHLVRQGEYRFSDDQIQRVRELIGSNTAVDEDVCALQHTLGDILAADAQYDEAFHAYAKANAIEYRLRSGEGSTFDAETFESQIEATMCAFDQEFLQSASTWGLQSELPVFVVGMLRSGTTLVEQILTAHPHIEGVGERPDLSQHFLAACEDDPRNARFLDEKLMQVYAKRYLRDLENPAAAATRIIDKTLSNFLFLGLIASMFPKARIIYCRRQLRDIAISCFFQRFADVNWSSRLEDIGVSCRGYTRLMNHWQQVLPGRIHSVAYEELVTDSENVCRGLLDFCGLPWSDACLEFHRQRTAIRTASRVQVRQPFYTKAVGRWENYAAHLAALEPFLE